MTLELDDEEDDVVEEFIGKDDKDCKGFSDDKGVCFKDDVDVEDDDDDDGGTGAITELGIDVTTGAIGVTFDTEIVDDCKLFVDSLEDFDEVMPAA